MEDQPNGAKPEDPAARVAASDTDLYQMVQALRERVVQEAEARRKAEADLRIERLKNDGLKKANEDSHYQIQLLQDEIKVLQAAIDQLKSDHGPTPVELRLQEQLTEARQRIQRLSEFITKLQSARLDDLTRLPRRREFLRHVGWHFENEKRDHIFLLILFDIKFFKRINDEISYEMGDAAIQRTAKVLRNEVRIRSKSDSGEHRRPSRVDFADIVARIGGDEFAVGLFLDPEHFRADADVEKNILSIVNRFCIRYDQIQWAQEYQTWTPNKKGGFTAENIASIKPSLNPGVLIIHAGHLPRIPEGSGVPKAKRLLELLTPIMKQSKAYEKETGRRRIFYQVADFQDQKLRIVSEKFYDSPAD